MKKEIISRGQRLSSAQEANKLLAAMNKALTPSNSERLEKVKRLRNWIDIHAGVTTASRDQFDNPHSLSELKSVLSINPCYKVGLSDDSKFCGFPDSCTDHELIRIKYLILRIWYTDNENKIENNRPRLTKEYLSSYIEYSKKAPIQQLTIPEEFSALADLEVLFLRAHYIRFNWNNILLPKLWYFAIHIDGNIFENDCRRTDEKEALTDFWGWMNATPNLKTLDLSYNRLTPHYLLPKLPKNGPWQSSITSFWCVDCDLEGLPSWMKRSRSIKKVNLSGNEFSSLRGIFDLFPNLEELEISNNRIIELSTDIFSLNKLKVLDLSGNEVSCVQPGFETMSELEDLYLDLDYFDVSNHNACEIGGLANLTTLCIKIEASGCDVVYPLLESLGKLKKIKRLEISVYYTNDDDELDEELIIPDSFGNLENLVDLTIEGGCFKQFPPCILKLKNLQLLNYSDTEIEDLNSSLLVAFLGMESLIDLCVPNMNNMPEELVRLDRYNILGMVDGE